MVASGGKPRLTRFQQRKQERCVSRTLDNLPMKYDSDDSRSLATSYRSIRSATMEEAMWASQVSRNQFSESRRLFDDCLTKETLEGKQQSCNSAARSSRSEVKYRAPTVHTGPTRYGSPLYMHQQQEVTSHHHRTPSEPPPKYFRAKSGIEDTLKRSNSAFRVTPRSSSKMHLSKTPITSYPGFDLVPNTVDIELGKENYEERQSITPVHIMTRQPYVKMKISSLYPEPTVTMPDCMPVIKVDRTAEGEGKQETSDKGSTKLQNRTALSNVKDKTAMVEEPKLSSQLAVNVGKVKVTSNSIKSSSSTKGKRDTGTTTDKVSVKSKSIRQRGRKKASQDTLELTELKVHEPRLPTYICPSSEEKSREARIRHWLCDNTFTCADRHVPLVF